VEDAAGRALPDWDAGAALEVMDRHNIRTAMLSVSTPGTTPGEPAEAADVARAVNEFSAAVVGGSPDRFGYFATVPLPDVELAIAETRHALDNLRADGVTLLANSLGVYLGSPELDPLMEELDARNAVAFVHPGTLPDRRSTASRRSPPTFSSIRAAPLTSSSATRWSAATQRSASFCRTRGALCRTPRIAWR
jgi:predicted TIM-barrel fold metal-dependent hydrolase